MDMEPYRKKLWGRESAQRRFATERIIFAALDRVEEASKRLQSAQRELTKAISDDPDQEWSTIWDKFLAAGGLTRDELTRWMVTQKQIRPVTAKRQHLRLVNHGHRRRAYRLVRHDPPEAA
jgi:hypothetical protein